MKSNRSCVPPNDKTYLTDKTNYNKTDDILSSSCRSCLSYGTGCHSTGYSKQEIVTYVIFWTVSETELFHWTVPVTLTFLQIEERVSERESKVLRFSHRELLEAGSWGRG
jgi:hypothetical protein